MFRMQMKRAETELFAAQTFSRCKWHRVHQSGRLSEFNFKGPVCENQSGRTKTAAGLN